MASTSSSADDAAAATCHIHTPPTPKRSASSTPGDSTDSKRRRLSDDDDGENDIIIIEEVEASPQPNADLGITMHGHSDNFKSIEPLPIDVDDNDLEDATSDIPTNILAAFTQAVATPSLYIPQDVIRPLAVWLHDHLDGAESLNPLSHESISFYQRNAKAFDMLGTTLLQLPNVRDPFAQQTPNTAARLSAYATLQQLYEDTIQLAIRLTAISSVFIDEALRNPPDQHAIQVPFLVFVLVASQYLHFKSAFTRDLVLNHGLSIERVTRMFKLHPTSTASLHKLLDVLPLHLNTVVNAWRGVQSVLHLMSHSAYAESIADQSSATICQELQHHMVMLHTKILPLLSQKSPKALPDRFYDTLYTDVGGLLDIVLHRADAVDVEKFLEFLMETAGFQLSDLQVLSADDSKLMCKYAWQIELTNTLIHTDFMAPRKFGVISLRELLHHATKVHGKQQSDGSLHPLVHSIRDIIKRSAIVPYIFGPQSHAGLMWDTKGILAFMAFTDAWNSDLADCIWSVCTEGNEDELLKSAFNALDEACQHLHHDDLLHLLVKFSTTPIEKFSPFAADFFARLLRRINTSDVQAWQQSNGLAMPYMICMDILFSLDTAAPSTAVFNIRTHAISQLLLPLTHGAIAHQRAITEQCSAYIQGHTPQASVSSDILRCYMQEAQKGCASQNDLVLPRLEDAVAEFVQQIRSIHRQNGSVSANTYWTILSRAELITYLLSLVSPTTSQLEVEEGFWSHAVGTQAIEGWRGDIFEHILIIASRKSQTQLTSAFLQRRLKSYLPSLPSSQVTKRLIGYLQSVLEKSHTVTFDSLKENILWQQLLRFALSVQDEDVKTPALAAICNLLQNLCLVAEFTAEHTDTLADDSTTEGRYHQQYVQRSFEIFYRLLERPEVRDTLAASRTKFEALLSSSQADTAQQACSFLRLLPLTADTHALETGDLLEQLHDQPWRLVYNLSSAVEHLKKPLHGTSLEREAQKTLAKMVDILLASMTMASDAVLYSIARIMDNLLETMGLQELASNDSQRLGDICSDLLQRAKRTVEQAAGHWPTELEAQLISALYNLMLRICHSNPKLWTVCPNTGEFVSFHRCIILDATTPYCLLITERISAYCQTTLDRDVAQVYITTLTDILPHASHRPESFIEICGLLRRMLGLHEMKFTNKDWLATLLASYASLLSKYEHKETMLNRLRDNVIYAIMDLVFVTSHALRVLQDSSQQHVSPEEIFDRLLFPPGHNDLLNSNNEAQLESSKHVDTPRDIDQEYSSSPLIHPHTRFTCYRMISSLCITPAQYTAIFDRVRRVLEKTEGRHPYDDSDSWAREALLPGGLINLGMTCYVNSLLQQIFSNVHLRSCLLNMTIIDRRRQELLIHVQRLFANLQDSAKASIQTNDLATIMNISPFLQDDVHSFYTIFMGALEENILVPDERKQFMALYSGKSITRIMGSCGHMSTQTETLNGLSITVQNKAGLEASLDEYFHAEALQGDNQYKCTMCIPERGGGLVSAVKHTHLEHIPDTLSICLKRCSINAFGLEEKNNDMFSFPPQIDLACYQQAQGRDASSATHEDIFALVGVIVHMGTLSAGHYWSFVRRYGMPASSNEAWIRLEDTNVNFLSYDDMYRESVGGLPGNRSSAYMLLYQRQASIKSSAALLEPNVVPSTVDPISMPPRVNIPEPYYSELNRDNTVAYATAHKFSPALREFLSYITQCSLGALSKQSHEHIDDDQEQREPHLCKAIGMTLGLYTSHVAITRNDQGDLIAVERALNDKFNACSATIAQFLEAAAIDKSTTFRSYHHSNIDVTKQMDSMKVRYLRVLRDSRSKEYSSAFHSALYTHRDLMHHRHIDPLRARWPTYFTFALRLVMMGSDELDEVLCADYVQFVVDVVQTGVLGCSRRRSREVAHANVDQLEFLWGFLFRMLEATYHGSRDRRQARYEKLTAAFKLSEVSGIKVLPWLMAVTRQDWSSNALHNFACGKLVRLLVSSELEDMREAVSDTIIGCCRTEECYIEPTCALSLNYIEACGDGLESRRLILSMLDALDDEVVSGEAVIELLNQVADTAPFTAISTMNGWVSHFIAAEPTQQDMALEMVTSLLRDAQPLYGIAAADHEPSVDVVRLTEIDDMMSCLLSRAVNGSLVGRQLTYVVKILQSCRAFKHKVQDAISKHEHLASDNQLQEGIRKLTDQCDVARRFCLSVRQWQEASGRQHLGQVGNDTKRPVLEIDEEESEDEDNDEEADQDGDETGEEEDDLTSDEVTDRDEAAHKAGK